MNSRETTVMYRRIVEYRVRKQTSMATVLHWQRTIWIDCGTKYGCFKCSLL